MGAGWKLTILFLLLTGPIGTLCMMTAKAQGAGQVVIADIDQGRLELAKKLGADHVVNTK